MSPKIRDNFKMAIFRLCHVRQCNVLLCPAKFVFPQSRLISVKVQGKSKPTLPNLETKDHPTAKGKLKRRFFQRFFDYLSGYEKVLKSVLPDSAVKIIELFSSGTKLLFADMKEFAWTNHVLTSTTNWEKACNTLSRHQLEVLTTTIYWILFVDLLLNYFTANLLLSYI